MLYVTDANDGSQETLFEYEHNDVTIAGTKCERSSYQLFGLTTCVATDP